MDLRELEWFVALAESEHVTETSEGLSISQPTLSRAVGRLEKHFGVQLFERSGNRIRLNRYGEVLRAHALRSLGEISTAEQRISSMIDPGKGIISLAFVTSYGSWLVPQLIQEYRRDAPEARFILEGAAAGHALEMLRNQAVDVAIISPEPRDEAVDWHPIAQEPLRLVVPDGHRLAGRKAIDLAEAASESFLALRPEFGLRQISDALCTASGFTPGISVEATEIPTLWGLVRAGMGVSILPASIRGPLSKGTQQVPLTDEGAIRVAGAAVMANRRQPPPVALFIDFLRAHPLLRP
jgi:LysR family transcriptional activator of glutamate synthase operon